MAIVSVNEQKKKSSNCLAFFYVIDSSSDVMSISSWPRRFSPPFFLTGPACRIFKTARRATPFLPALLHRLVFSYCHVMTAPTLNLITYPSQVLPLYILFGRFDCPRVCTGCVRIRVCVCLCVLVCTCVFTCYGWETWVDKGKFGWTVNVSYRQGHLEDERQLQW